MMNRLPYFLLALGVFVCDRVTKTLIEAHLDLYESRPIIPGFFDLTHTRNTGIAFGIFSNSQSAWVPYALSVSSAVAFIAILIFALRSPRQNWKLQLGFMLVLGGAAGNLHDRIRYGFVVDFIEVFYQNYHWPTFNVADSAITIGIALLFFDILMKKPEAHQTPSTA